jgi:hypothetical protein
MAWSVTVPLDREEMLIKALRNFLAGPEDFKSIVAIQKVDEVKEALLAGVRFARE